jgi:glycosyltransferase involved in cell wall biosynthesis
MRILQVHNRYRSSAPSGENRVVDLEAAHLVRRGHVVERFEAHSDDIATWPAVKRALLPGRVVWSKESYRDLRRVLRDQRPDVVHVHNVIPLLSCSVLYACAREQVPVVATFHNYRLVCPAGGLFRDGHVCHDCVGRLPVPAIRHGCYRDSALATIPMVVSAEAHSGSWRHLVSAFVCISKSQRDLLAPFQFPEDRVFVKHNLVPLAEAVVPPAGAGDTVLYAGRLDHAKGAPLLMEAWDRYTAASGTGSLRLVVAGAGRLEGSVAAWAHDRRDIEVLGLVRPDECRALMAAARAVVVPSQWEEPFGLVVVEAMAAGSAVIAPAHGSFPELIVDGQEGRLFHPGRAESLAQAFGEVENYPERFRCYGQNARRGYEARFDPDANIDQLVSIYEFAVHNLAPTRRWLTPLPGGSHPWTSRSALERQVMAEKS